MRVCAIFTSMILAGSLATAQDSGLQAMRTGDDGRGWEAVGLLKVDSKGFCTGALIEPDLVLTAAHCVMDAATGEYVRPASIEFRAGWRGGRAQSYRLGRRTIVHPDYVVSPDGSRSRIANDVALIELDRPIRDTRTNPFPVGEQPRK